MNNIIAGTMGVEPIQVTSDLVHTLYRPQDESLGCFGDADASPNYIYTASYNNVIIAIEQGFTQMTETLRHTLKLKFGSIPSQVDIKDGRNEIGNMGIIISIEHCTVFRYERLSPYGYGPIPAAFSEQDRNECQLRNSEHIFRRTAMCLTSPTGTTLRMISQFSLKENWEGTNAASCLELMHSHLRGQGLIIANVSARAAADTVTINGTGGYTIGAVIYDTEEALNDALNDALEQVDGTEFATLINSSTEPKIFVHTVGDDGTANKCIGSTRKWKDLNDIKIPGTNKICKYSADKGSKLNRLLSNIGLNTVKESRRTIWANETQATTAIEDGRFVRWETTIENNSLLGKRERENRTFILAGKDICV